MSLIQRLLGGRPMKHIEPVFKDVTTGKLVHLWEDCYGRRWMAYTRWGWTRVADITPEDLKKITDKYFRP